MPAFTDLAGLPMTANVALLRGWLRGRLGFDGVIISDYNAIGELIQHGVAADLAEAAALALKAGVDIDMMSDAYRRGLPIALARGLVTVRRSTGSAAGFDAQAAPGTVRRPLSPRRGTGGAAGAVGAGSWRASVAARALVLLKNERSAAAGRRRAAAGRVGPLADAAAEMRGPWWAAAEAEGQVSVLAGLRAALPAADILYAPGVDIEGEDMARH